MAVRKGTVRIALQHRLANPPALFVGRQREQDWLEAAVARAPVAVVTGPGGIGKTSLVARFVHGRVPEQAGRTVYFGLRPGEPAAQLRHDLVRVLAKSTRRAVDADRLTGDPEELTEVAIDLAEDAGLWIVLDDAHHAEADEMGELLTMLASYASASRWLVTSRVEPKARALAGQVLPLGGLGEGDLIAIAEGLAAGRDDVDVHRAVASAAGSPWFLQQYVCAGTSGVELTRERLLESLPADVEPFLRVLGLLRMPLPEEVLATLVRVPDPASIAALERRGLVQIEPAGVRLHDVVAGWLQGPVRERDDDERERVAAALLRTGASVAIVEAARLYRDAGAFDALAALLDDHAEALFADALAPRLWGVIGEIRDPRMVRHQLACAAEMGNPTALGAVRQPVDAGPEERLAWAATIYAQGDVAQAQAIAGEIQSSAPPPIAHEAVLLRARCLLHDGQPERAVRALREIAIDEPDLAFRRDALLSRGLAELDDPDIDATLGEVRRRAEAMDAELEALHDVAVALHTLGRRESADELLERVAASPRGGRTSLLVAREALLTRARLRLEAGDVHDATTMIDAIRPYVRSASLLRPFVFELDAARRLAVGDLAGLAAVLETATREAARVDRRLHARLLAHAERLALLDAIPPTDDASAASDDPTARVAWIRRRRRVRHRGAIDPPAAPEPAPIERLLLDADRAIVGGAPGVAVEAARFAVHEAGRRGQRLDELEAFAALLDALAVAGPPEAHAAAARELVDRTRPLGSMRGRLLADFHERFFDPSVLERLAASPNVARAVARRARALLGGRPRLDAIDEVVLEALRARAPSLRVRTAIGDVEPWRAGWGLDGRSRSVWLGDGRTIDLAKKAIPWRLLLALVERGGAASKEALVRGVWEERVYHPGRHDPRVHMMMRKLREALEDDPSAPTRLLTADDGYRLGGVVRVIDEPPDQ